MISNNNNSVLNEIRSINSILIEIASFRFSEDISLRTGIVQLINILEKLINVLELKSSDKDNILLESSKQFNHYLHSLLNLIDKVNSLPGHIPLTDADLKQIKFICNTAGENIINAIELLLTLNTQIDFKQFTNHEIIDALNNNMNDAFNQYMFDLRLLPDEITTNIYSFLTPGEQVRLNLVAKRFADNTDMRVLHHAFHTNDIKTIDLIALTKSMFKYKAFVYKNNCLHLFITLLGSMYSQLQRMDDQQYQQFLANLDPYVSWLNDETTSLLKSPYVSWISDVATTLLKAYDIKPPVILVQSSRKEFTANILSNFKLLLYPSRSHRIDHSKRFRTYTLNLAGVDLTNVDLANPEFIDGKSRLKYSLNLSYTNLSNANLFAANVEEATFYHSNLTDTNFTGANLKRAKLDNANCMRTIFDFANLDHAHLTNARINDVSTFGAKIVEAYNIQMIINGLNLLPANTFNGNLDDFIAALDELYDREIKPLLNHQRQENHYVVTHMNRKFFEPFRVAVANEIIARLASCDKEFAKQCLLFAVNKSKFFGTFEYRNLLLHPITTLSHLKFGHFASNQEITEDRKILVHALEQLNKPEDNFTLDIRISN